MSKLLLLTDVSQVDEILECCPEWLDRARLVTTDLTVAAELERLQIPFIDGWSFLTPEDIDRNWHTARALAGSWWDESLASTEYRGVRLAEAPADWFCLFEIVLNAH